MDDTKLLELAGRAAGEEYGPENNPLDRDDLALRLAVKLNLTTVFHPVLNQALCRQYWTTSMDAESREDAEKHADPCAATRRAIVRAAAAIGERTP